MLVLGALPFFLVASLRSQDDAPAAAESAAADSTAAELAPVKLPTSIGPRSVEAEVEAPLASSAAATVTESDVAVTESDAAVAVTVEAPASSLPDPLVESLEEPTVPMDLLTPDGTVPTPTESVVVNLINRLVDRGVLTQGDAAELVTMARRDAAIANQNAAAAALVAADAAMSTEEDIVVTHIPEPVKRRLREEIRQDLLAEGALAPTHYAYANLEDDGGKETVIGPIVEAELPAWVKKTRLYGDLRVRYDASRFPDGNDNTGTFPNFNRINTGAPFDVAGFEFSPQNNVDEDRRRFRLRARVGIEHDLGDGFSVGLRAATGNDNSPVSTNQTLSGNFNKYDLWLDQAYLRWQSETYPGHLSAVVGRFENPFFRATDIMWDNDVHFDGFAVRVQPDLSDGFRPFVNAGVFPIFNTGFDYPSNAPSKFESTDRYLYGAQGGIDFSLGNRVEGKFGVGYHDFDGVQGELSDPFVPLSANDAGSTDSLRPTFAQKGNTYMPLRRILPDPLNNFGTTNQFQYYGLASDFEILSYNARLDFNAFEPYQISLLGEYALNTGYDENEVEAVAVNNRGPLGPTGRPGAFEGGNQAWSVAVQFGHAVLAKRGDWNTHIGYRYIESDAVLDAFADSDFGLGGTNMEGFVIGAGYSLRPGLNLNLRWMSADEIAGPPLSSDILMFDLNAKF